MANSEQSEGGSAPSARLKKTAPSGPEKHPNVRVLEGLLGRNAKKTRRARLRIRHLVIISGFAAMVALPTVATSFYMAFLAVDQYESTTSFTVRAIDSTAMASDLVGMFTQTGATSTVSDSYILSDYILSAEMVRMLDAEFDLDKLYGIRGGDFYFSLGPGLPLERKVEFWQSVATVSYDHSTNILQLGIRAFEPQQAQAVAAFVLARCEKLINELSDTSREEALRTARVELERSEKRLADARMAMHDFRDLSQDVDPIEGAKVAQQMVGQMEERLTRLQADLATARNQMAEDTPRIRVIKSQISSIQSQLVKERQRLGRGESGLAGGEVNPNAPLSEQPVAGKLQIYEALETEREFSQQAYTAALANMEKARIDATSKQRYLATFIQPSLAESALYPRRLLITLIVFLAGLFTWGMLTLGYYNLRDRA